MVDLDQEYKYFNTNRAQLLKEHLNKYIVIKDGKLIGSYDSEAEAYSETIKLHELGTFLIQRCLPEKDLPPQVFHSRVVFG